MAQSVYGFKELPLSLAEAAGGKGALLSLLFQKGYPIPSGFVILTTAFGADGLLPEAWNQVEPYLNQLSEDKGFNGTVAVRSSAAGEDSSSVSFAGVFDTKLNVNIRTDIRKAIQEVYHSKEATRVKSYSNAKGIAVEPEMAVIVQKMVPAVISGVLFSADPVTGSPATMSGAFTKGLGDQLVSGQVNGQSFTLGRPKGRYQGPVELKSTARSLHRLAIQLEKELASPQDMEWALTDKKLYLLQSRPITTMLTGLEKNHSLNGFFLWSNVNFGEAIPDVMTPFTASAMEIGPMAKEISFNGTSAYGVICGRPYLNISVFASILSALGKGNDKIVAFLDDVLHLSLPPDTQIPTISASKQAVLIALFQLTTFGWRQRRDVRKIPALLAKNPTWCRLMIRDIAAAQSAKALLGLWEQSLEPHILRIWFSLMSGTNHYTAYASALKSKLSALVGPDDADALLSGISKEDHLLASMGPLLGLVQLSTDKLSQEQYLDQYGHRGDNELELSTPNPREDSDWLDKQLAAFRQNLPNVHTLLAAQREKSHIAWNRLKQIAPGRVRNLRKKINQAAERAHLREQVRSEYVRVFSIWRQWALQAGRITGIQQDIFFLRLEEVTKLLKGGQAPVQLIPDRKKIYAKYKQLPPYPTVINGCFDPLKWAADPHRRLDYHDSHISETTPSTATITGAAGSAGTVEGFVRCLAHPEDGEQLKKGEILVTTQTNIGWTLVFPKTAAIITDVGAPLSHASIVARELGIPAVVGCGNATMLLKTGDRVRVDGTQGKVEILSP